LLNPNANALGKYDEQPFAKTKSSTIKSKILGLFATEMHQFGSQRPSQVTRGAYESLKCPVQFNVPKKPAT
jgi:hypothetical protein